MNEIPLHHLCSVCCGMHWERCVLLSTLLSVVILMFLMDVLLCPSALGCSSPRKAGGGSPILQECLSRAIGGAADRSRGGVNGRVPASRTLRQSKPQGSHYRCSLMFYKSAEKHNVLNKYLSLTVQCVVVYQ